MLADAFCFDLRRSQEQVLLEALQRRKQTPPRSRAGPLDRLGAKRYRGLFPRGGEGLNDIHFDQMQRCKFTSRGQYSSRYIWWTYRPRRLKVIIVKTFGEIRGARRNMRPYAVQLYSVAQPLALAVAPSLEIDSLRAHFGLFTGRRQSGSFCHYLVDQAEIFRFIGCMGWEELCQKEDQLRTAQIRHAKSNVGAPVR
jgi:hypothetical protein